MALPITLAMGLERGMVQPGDHVGLLGIGSGINCLMMAAQWQRVLVRSQLEPELTAQAAAS